MRKAQRDREARSAAVDDQTDMTDPGNRSDRNMMGSRGRVRLLAMVGGVCALTALAASAPQAATAPAKKGPVDDVAERYHKARTPPQGQPATPVVLSQGDCKSFAKDFQKAGEKDRGREADGLFYAGVVYDQCGLARDAEDMYRRAVSKNPNQQQALNNLGVLYKNSNRMNEALAQFDASIRADPKSALAAQAYNNKAVVLYERTRQGGGSYDEAIGSLRRALAVDSESMFAYQMLATIFLQTAESDRSKLKLAQLVCDSAIKMNPDYAPIYNTLGLIRLRGKEVSAALAEFRKAADRDPGLTDAQLNIAAISLSVRSYKQAEDAFQAVLKKDPNNFDAVVGMGVAARGQRRIDEAETWYKKAAALDPRNCSVTYNLGVLYQDYKGGGPDDLKKAQEFYNRFTSCVGHDSDTVKDARRRSKDIDDTFRALDEQRKLEAEQKKMQEEMERQQKQQGGAAPAPEPAK